MQESCEKWHIQSILGWGRNFQGENRGRPKIAHAPKVVYTIANVGNDSTTFHLSPLITEAKVPTKHTSANVPPPPHPFKCHN